MKVINPSAINRRSFLKLVALGMGSQGFPPWNKALVFGDFPENDRLGRVNAGKVDLKARPDIDSPTIGVLYEDAVVPWLRELTGKNTYRTNQRWVETPDGYIWSPYLQPVRNDHNESVEVLPESNGEMGLWVEVSMPYIDILLDNPPARSPGLQDPRGRKGRRRRACTD